MDVITPQQQSAQPPLGIVSVQAYANIESISIELVIDKIEKGEFEGVSLNGNWYLKSKNASGITTVETTEWRSPSLILLKVIVFMAATVAVMLLLRLLSK